MIAQEKFPGQQVIYPMYPFFQLGNFPYHNLGKNEFFCTINNPFTKTKEMSVISATIGKDHYRTQIASAGHTIVSDEPMDKGGQNSGMNPDELLASSLGACTCITLRMYADRKGWPLEEVVATVKLTYEEGSVLPLLKVHLKLIGHLDEQQKQRLHEIANKCPMHKALAQPLHIDTVVQD